MTPQAKRTLESQLTELETNLAEANENAMRGGRAAMAKMEGRIKELEMGLGSVQVKRRKTLKNIFIFGIAATL